jgi:hypothetical protein
MWKAAFPTASTAAEKDETNWVKKHFDISGPPETIRLAGTWLPVPIARQLSAEYKLTSLSPPIVFIHAGLTPLSPITPETIDGLSKAEPDYDTVLRSHENGMADTPNVPPSKRRKAASPKGPEKKSFPSSGRTTRSSVDTATATASPRLSVGRQLHSRTKSPAPATRTPATRSTPSRAVKSKIMTPPAEKDDPLVAAAVIAADAEPELLNVDPDEDIAESKALVDKIKAEHSDPSLKTTTPTKTLPKRGAAAKRAREEAEDVLPNGKPLIKMNVDAEPADPNVDREIASNRRIVKWRESLPSLPTLPQLEPKQKSAAWGTLAFALAIGAT